LTLLDDLNYSPAGPVNASLDRKARSLEAKVADNSQTIEQLRQERSLLMKDHKELQRRFTDISEVSRHPVCYLSLLTILGHF
jgi:type II secretory pathway predicted ATPase ExeA